MQFCSCLSILWHCLSLGLEWKLTFFQSCGHCWVFHICGHIECSTFTTSSFRIWNSSTGIPSPPLALLIVMLPKAHLTSHSKISGSRCMITSSWLSCLWSSFLYSSSVFSCHLFLISSASVRSILSVLYWAHLCMKYSLGISNFLEEISNLSHCVVFLYFFALITEEGFLISPWYCLELCIQMGIIFSFLLCFSLPFSFHSFVRPPQTAILLFCISFSWGWSWSLISCTMSGTSVHSSSGTLSIYPLNLFFTFTV